MKTECHSTKNKNMYQAKTNRSCIRMDIIKRHAAIQKRKKALPHICYLPCIVHRVNEVSTSSSLCYNPCFALVFVVEWITMDAICSSSHFLFIHCLTNTKKRNLGGGEQGIEAGEEYANRLFFYIYKVWSFVNGRNSHAITRIFSYQEGL